LNNHRLSLLPPYHHGGGHVLYRAADRFEQGDLLVRAAALGLAGAQLEQVAVDVRARNDAALQRDDDVARLLERAGAGVDVDAGALDRVVVRLAHLAGEATDEVDVGAGPEPAA